MEIISIAFDPATEQSQARQELGISSPMAVDADHTVSEMYDVMQWAAGTGEPGHTFILVDTDGTIRWIRDYGAPQNGGSMYVETAEMVAQVRASLSG